ncbi:MAG: hypothetical protein HY826_07355 [Actinobacteria bacterium]|nr:hypothetical protein [Actinomycetota bacterium]
MIAAVAIGVGLAAAPAIFQMFGRAPMGGEMITEFEPYMTEAKVATLRGYLDTIDLAEAESRTQLRPALVDSGSVEDSGYALRFPNVATFNDGWSPMRADMTDLVDTIERNRGNYAAVAALPPFPLFPWFFVVPGLLIAGSGIAAIRSSVRRRLLLLILAALGFAVALAPVALQMFTRAPEGAEMIDDFRPMMARERVQRVQLYFVTLGAAEGQLRNAAVPLAAELAGQSPDEAAATYPAISQLSQRWPAIVGEFAPMIGAMSDNLDNFAAVDALPSFSLFPWFFVGPGLLVGGLALAARKQVGA